MPAASLDGEAHGGRRSRSRVLPAAVRAPAAHRATTSPTRTPAAHAAALKTLRRVPDAASVRRRRTAKGIIIFPGVDGGGEWGGPAFDPETGLLYVNSNEMAWLLKMVPRERQVALRRELRELPRRRPRGSRHGPSLVGRRHAGSRASRSRRSSARARVACRRSRAALDNARDQRSRELPRHRPGHRGHRRRRIRSILKYRSVGFDIFLDHEGYPAIKPPWGTLNAIDLNTGDDPLVDSVRRVPEARRAGTHEHRHRQLRRRDRDRRTGC